MRRCLEKSPDNRLQSAKDLAFAIEVATDWSQAQSLSTVPSPRAATRKLLFAGIGLMMLVFAGGFITSQLRSPTRHLHRTEHSFMGTPAYMGPEQAEMSELDIDIRSVRQSVDDVFMSRFTVSLLYPTVSFCAARTLTEGDSSPFCL